MGAEVPTTQNMKLNFDISFLIKHIHWNEKDFLIMHSLSQSKYYD